MILPIKITIKCFFYIHLGCLESKVAAYEGFDIITGEHNKKGTVVAGAGSRLAKALAHFTTIQKARLPFCLLCLPRSEKREARSEALVRQIGRAHV